MRLLPSLNSNEFYLKHKHSILFNKNLIIAGLCSLVLTPIVTQYYYYNKSSDSFEVSLVSLFFEYLIETPIFAFLFYLDNRKAYVNPTTRVRDIHAIKTDIKKLLAVFSLSDVIYAIAAFSIQFNLMEYSKLQPFEAVLISSIIAWAIFFIIINLSAKAVRLFDRQRLRKSIVILLELRYVVLILLGIIVLVNSFIFLASVDTRVVYTNLTIIVTAATALCAALVVSARQFKTNSPYKKTFALLAAGIAIWFTAEVTWTYYQLGIGIETPFPSIADFFWLVGYVPLTYHLYKIYSTSTTKVIDRDTLVTLSAIASTVVCFLLYLTFSITGQQLTILELTINLAYPVLDTIMLIPAVVILWSFRKGEPAYTHWIMICLFIIFVYIADVGYNYALAIDEDSASQQQWIWDMFYNAGYLSIAGALFWYNRYLVLTKDPLLQ